VHISAWTSWNSALPILKHSLLPTLTYSRPFWTDYQQQQGHHLPSHLGSSSELLHRLAKDVKLSAHGRHPTVYLVIFVVLVFTFIFIFILFSCITFVFSFQRQKGYFNSSLGVCYEPCQSKQFSNSQSRSALSM
jgi:hypothetical protein